MMKKISTRMLVCVLTVAVLCSILAVGVIAADNYFAFSITSAGTPSTSNFKWITVNKSQLGSNAKLTGVAGHGHGQVLIVNKNYYPRTGIMEFGKDGANIPSTINLPYLPKWMLSSSMTLSPVIMNLETGLGAGSSCSLGGYWTP